MKLRPQSLDPICRDLRAEYLAPLVTPDGEVTGTVCLVNESGEYPAVEREPQAWPEGWVY